MFWQTLCILAELNAVALLSFLDSQLIKAAVKFRDEYEHVSHLVAPAPAPKPTAAPPPGAWASARGRVRGLSLSSKRMVYQGCCGHAVSVAPL